jgi:hypothetical protein
MGCKFIGGLLLLLSHVCFGQQFFYDSKRDKQTQEATEAVKDITTSPLFEKMLRNAEKQLNLEANALAEWQKLIGRGAFDNVSVWNDPKENPMATPSNFGRGCSAHRLNLMSMPQDCKSLRCRIEQLELSLSVAKQDPAPSIQKVETEIKALKAEIANLKEQLQKNNDQSILAIAVDQIDNTADLLEYAKQLQKTGVLGSGAAINQVAVALEQTKSFAVIIRDIWRGYEALRKKPGELIPLHEALDLQLLKIEADRLTQLAKIYGRLDLDSGRVQSSILNAKKHLAPVINTSTPIDETLSALSKPVPKEVGNSTCNAACVAEIQKEREKALDGVLLGLHYAAQALAEADLSVKLCSVREGGLLRISNLRRDSAEVAAKEGAAYEGLQRLGLYYKSGIKPSELANLIFSLIGAGSLPAAAIR